MKKPSKTVSVQLPIEDIEALESLIGQTIQTVNGEVVVKRLSDAMRVAMAITIMHSRIMLEAERKKAEKAEIAREKREAKRAAANGI